jgi:hypothetical protein
MAAQPHIVYDPPYGGQAIRAKSHRDAFARAAELLRSVTDADPDVPEALELQIFEPSPDESRGWLEPSVRTAEARLGPGHRRRWATGTLDLHLVGWRLERAAIAPLLELLEEVDPRERTTYGPVSLGPVLLPVDRPGHPPVLPARTRRPRAPPRRRRRCT